MTRKSFTWRRLHQGDAVTPDIPALAISTPNRSPTFEGDVLVPALQATITGLLLGTAAAALAYVSLQIVFLDAWVVTTPVALALAWLWRLSIATGTLWRLEQYAGVDLDGDGIQGRPESSHLAVQNPAEARDQVARQTRERARSTHLAELVRFVNRCYQIGTSEAAHNIAPSDRGKYIAARDLLLNLGLARWKVEGKPRAGWELTTDHDQTLAILRQHVMELGDST
jgi:hypothetical protein